MTEPSSRPAPGRLRADIRQQDLARAAFRDLHGTRLHGFALLVTLGDRPLAGRVAAAALADGLDRLGQLRHPERAAAWLRACARRLLPRRAARDRRDEAERRAALGGLGAPDHLFDALAPLSMPERCALVAADIERFEPLDVATIVGADRASLPRLLRSARRRYLEASSAAEVASMRGADAPVGALAARVRDAAARTMGAGVGEA